MNEPPAKSSFSLAAGALAIFVLVFVVYSPILPGSFLMDDHRLLKDDNPLLNGLLTPANIWFQTDFPLSNVAWWLEWQAFGEHPAGYHAVNILLHAFSAVLLWRVLVRLKIPAAWLAAVLYALHPVCVHSVTRIAELKNTLSLPFFLFSLWAYLRYENASPGTADDQPNTAARGAWYGLALVAFVLALFSKTSTIMLPAVLMLVALWQRRKITPNDCLQTAPFFVLSLSFGLMSIWFQKHQALQDAGQTLAPENWWTRLVIAAHVVCFYLGKAWLPIQLNIVYPRWTMAGWMPYVPLGLLAGVTLAGLAFWKTWGRHLLFGLGCFVALLFPVLGFFDSQFLVKWQVSDHLQYLPLMVPVSLAVAWLASLTGRGGIKYVGVVLILVSGLLTFQRARLFASEESLLQDTLAKNPAASDAQNDLGTILAMRKDLDGALTHFAAAVRIDPQNADALLNLAHALILKGKYDEAEGDLKTLLNLKPNNSAAHVQLAKIMLQRGDIPGGTVQLTMAQTLSPKPDAQIAGELATIYFHTQDFRHAIVEFQKMLAIQPDTPEALSNLAWIEATCGDASLRNGPLAVQHAEAACRLTAYQKSAMISTLGAAYAEAGRFPDAIASTQRALNMEATNGETQYAAINRQLLQLFKSGVAYHQ